MSAIDEKPKESDSQDSKSTDDKTETASEEKTQNEDSSMRVPIPPELLTSRHPLKYCWSLWYHGKGDGKVSWLDTLKEIASFESVEDFWALITHITRASVLPTGSDYYLFKKGIQPMWEDKENVNGGRWIIQTSGRQSDTAATLDFYWIELLKCMVGDQFGGLSSEICGAVINVRQGQKSKIALWTTNTSDRDSNVKIGETVSDLLKLNQKIVYESHHSSQGRKSSQFNADYTVLPTSMRN